MLANCRELVEGGIRTLEQKRIRCLVAAALLTAACSIGLMTNTVEAREPGIGPAFPGGLTLGIPTGALPPPGIYGLQRFNYSSGNVVGASGEDTGINVSALVESTQVNFVTDWEILGARYMMFFAMPVMLDLNQSGAPVGNGSNQGLLNPVWKHVLSWDLGNGFHASAGIGNYFMVGNNKQSAAAPVVAPPFEYIIEPEFAISYLSKDWNITGQAVFNINGENKENGYKSGDQLNLAVSAIRNFDKWSAGLVGYYNTQITSDENNGTAYGGTVFGDSQSLALGGQVSYNFGPATARAYYTKNVYTRNAVDEENFWLHIDFKLP